MRYQIIMETLERARDCKDGLMVAVCISALKAHSLGWRKYNGPTLMRYIDAFNSNNS